MRGRAHRGLIGRCLRVCVHPLGALCSGRLCSGANPPPSELPLQAKEDLGRGRRSRGMSLNYAEGGDDGLNELLGDDSPGRLTAAKCSEIALGKDGMQEI